MEDEGRIVQVDKDTKQIIVSKPELVFKVIPKVDAEKEVKNVKKEVRVFGKRK